MKKLKMKKPGFKKLLCLMTVISMFAVMFSAGAKTSEITLKVGATPVPHAEILEIVKTELAKVGIALDILEYTDYVQPNLALDAGDLDANFFQHTPYLADFNRENGTKLVSAVDVHFEPLGLYPGRTASIDDIAEGAVIAVPNDTTNEARALLLVESLGLIELPADSGLDVTPRDIVSNPLNLSFMEIEAAQIPNFLPDVDLGVINGNYALSAGLSADDMLASEDASSTAAIIYANVVAVRVGDTERPEILELIKAITSDEVKAFIEEAYLGSVVTMFGDETPVVDAIRENGKIVIGVRGDDSPLARFEGHYAQRIALDMLGDAEAVVFNIVDETKISELLESGEIDVAICGITVDDENRQNMDFAFPYMKSEDGLTVAAAVKKGNADLVQWLNKEIVALDAENFFHNAYDSELKDTMGDDADAVVIEGGQVR